MIIIHIENKKMSPECFFCSFYNEFEFPIRVLIFFLTNFDSAYVCPSAKTNNFYNESASIC